MVGVQLAIQLVLKVLSIRGCLCRIELALSNSDARSKNVDEGSIFRHADRAEIDLVIFNKGKYVG